MILRPYQTATIQGARERIQRGAKSVLIIAPTGSGKTVVASDIIRTATERGNRTLFLAHRRELIGQTSDKLAAFGVSHGIIMRGVRPAKQRPVQVASKDTLIHRRDAMPDCELVVVDEAHHATATTYQRILGWYPRAKVLGLTATPWRADGKGLAESFDDWVLAAQPRELRDQGFLVPVGAWEYRSVDTKGLRSRGGDFVVDAELERRATDSGLMGDVVAEWLKHAGGCRTVVFACTVPHSLALCARFAEAGVAAEHVDANTNKDVRDSAFARLRAGSARVLCNVGIATEGLDIPELECAVLARPTKSLGLALQMIGRVLRPADGKAHARIHDHAGVLSMHGHPYDHRDYSPTRDSADVDTETRPMRTCTRCSCRYPQVEPRCPECGEPAPEPLPAGSGPAVPPEEAEAKRVEVLEGGARRSASPSERAREWAALPAREKVFILSRLFIRHGVPKGKRIYKWMSGDTESPSFSTSEAAWRIAHSARPDVVGTQSPGGDE